MVGLAGSIGKTTTKNLPAQALERHAPTIALPGIKAHRSWAVSGADQYVVTPAFIARSMTQVNVLNDA
ncbi:hypothetical protein OHA25_23010 [Nonomuraea sp. NBC_00507]|uniref:hypothetical protein n=1 Tax=Nonomuraea sp. NBC_00507 TaxID=2976002 RepID=UPI002E182475